MKRIRYRNKRLVDKLLEVTAPNAGAINFAYIVSCLLAREATLTKQSLLEILRVNINQAEQSDNLEYYSELLLALRFLESSSSEFSDNPLS